MRDRRSTPAPAGLTVAIHPPAGRLTTAPPTPPRPPGPRNVRNDRPARCWRHCRPRRRRQALSPPRFAAHPQRPGGCRLVASQICWGRSSSTSGPRECLMLRLRGRGSPEAQRGAAVPGSYFEIIALLQPRQLCRTEDRCRLLVATRCRSRCELGHEVAMLGAGNQIGRASCRERV